MSADNFADIAQHPQNGKWYILEGTMSDPAHPPLVDLDDCYDTERQAIAHADKGWYEYGVSANEWPSEWWERSGGKPKFRTLRTIEHKGTVTG